MRFFGWWPSCNPSFPGKRRRPNSTVKNQLVKALKNLGRVVFFFYAWGFKTDSDPNHRIFPIPSTAILLNPTLKQNPGYN